MGVSFCITCKLSDRYNCPPLLTFDGVGGNDPDNRGRQFSFIILMKSFLGKGVPSKVLLLLSINGFDILLA